MNIIPAILPVSREDLEKKLGILSGLVEEIQIDVVDGRFVSPASWPYSNGTDEFASLINEGNTLPYLGQLHYEIDLMVSAPEEVTGIWITAGANRITLHIESTDYLPRAITDLQVKYGHEKDFVPDLLAVGLALNVQSDLSLLEPLLEHADYVQFMGIATIGKQGEPFDPAVVERVVAFKKKHPDIAVQVDGGVSLATAPALLSAGVERLIVGSALWNAPNLAEELEKFNELSQQYGRWS